MNHNLRIEVVISLILGITGIVMAFSDLLIGLLALLAQIIGLTLGIRGLLKSSKKILAIISIILCIVGLIVTVTWNVTWNSQKSVIFSCRVDSIYCNFSVLEKICEMFNGDMGKLIKDSSPTVYHSCYNFSHSY